MADTSQSEQSPLVEPQTNGVLEGLDEDERSKMRPADIDAVSQSIICIAFQWDFYTKLLLLICYKILP